MSECIFCKMMKGEEHCRKLYENETAFCILDIAQVVLDAGDFISGRALVIPKKHVTRFYELEDEEAGQLFIATKIVANKIKRAFNPDFVTVFIRGQQVAHAHIILQPSIKGDPVEKLFTSMRSYFKIAPEDLLNDMTRKILES